MKNIPNISFKSWVDDEKETINLFSLAFGTHTMDVIYSLLPFGARCHDQGRRGNTLPEN